MRRITQSDVIKLAEELYKWSGENSLIGTMQGDEFIWYDDFKKYIMINRATDKHSIKNYRDLMRYYGLLEFDVFDRVYFKFKHSDKYKINKKTGLGGWME
jgi:hypothetical protein